MAHRTLNSTDDLGNDANANADAGPPAPPGTRATPLPPKARVRLSDRAGKAFPPNACVLGFGYFARRRVELLTITAKSIDAVVRGQRAQTVRVRIDAHGHALEVACTCVPRSLDWTACRHLWAVLLELDRTGAFDVLRGTTAPLALHPLATDLPPAPGEEPSPELPTTHAHRASAGRKVPSDTRPKKDAKRTDRSANAPGRAQKDSPGEVPPPRGRRKATAEPPTTGRKPRSVAPKAEPTAAKVASKRRTASRRTPTREATRARRGSA